MATPILSNVVSVLHSHIMVIYIMLPAVVMLLLVRVHSICLMMMMVMMST